MIPGRAAIIVLACSLVLVFATTVAAPGEVGLEAKPAGDGEGGLELTITGSGDHEDMKILVSHEDPLSGTVLDRVIEVPADQAANASIRLRGLRPALNYDIRLLEPRVELPKLSNDSSLVNASEIHHLPTQRIETAEAPRLHPQGDHTVAVHGFGFPGKGWAKSDMTGIAVTTDALVVVAYYEVERPNADSEEEIANAVARVSRDGGRSFGDPIALTEPRAHAFAGRIEVVPGPGALVTITESTFYHPNGTGPAEHTGPEIIRLDPAAGEVVDRLDFPEGVWHPRVSFAILPDDSTIVADPFQDEIVRVELNGTVTDTSAVEMHEVELATTPGGLVAVLFTNRSDTWRVNTWIVHSMDSGRTFTEPRPIAPLMDILIVEPRTMEMSPDGVAHASFFVPALAERPEPNDGLYLRVPLADPSQATVRRLAGSEPHALDPAGDNAWDPTLVVHGSRVWVFWNDQPTNSTYSDRGPHAAESVDGGLNFEPPYRLRPSGTPAHTLRLSDEAALFSDGRPLSVAITDGRKGLATVPLFDPLAIDDGTLTEVRSAADDARGTTHNATENEDRPAATDSKDRPATQDQAQDTNESNNASPAANTPGLDVTPRGDASSNVTDGMPPDARQPAGGPGEPPRPTDVTEDPRDAPGNGLLAVLLTVSGVAGWRSRRRAR